MLRIDYRFLENWGERRQRGKGGEIPLPPGEEQVGGGPYLFSIDEAKAKKFTSKTLYKKALEAGGVAQIPGLEKTHDRSSISVLPIMALVIRLLFQFLPVSPQWPLSWVPLPS